MSMTVADEEPKIILETDVSNGDIQLLSEPLVKEIKRAAIVVVLMLLIIVPVRFTNSTWRRSKLILGSR
jgi:hypothetical protein